MSPSADEARIAGARFATESGFCSAAATASLGSRDLAVAFARIDAVAASLFTPISSIRCRRSPVSRPILHRSERSVLKITVSGVTPSTSISFRRSSAPTRLLERLYATMSAE